MDANQMERELVALTEELSQIRKELECRTIRIEVRERIRERLRRVEARLARQRMHAGEGAGPRAQDREKQGLHPGCCEGHPPLD